VKQRDGDADDERVEFVFFGCCMVEAKLMELLKERSGYIEDGTSPSYFWRKYLELGMYELEIKDCKPVVLPA